MVVILPNDIYSDLFDEAMTLEHKDPPASDITEATGFYLTFPDLHKSMIIVRVLTSNTNYRLFKFSFIEI